jgi:hypothetical protein
VHAQKQSQSIDQKEKDGYIEDNTSTHVEEEAIQKPLAKSQGYSLTIKRSKGCIRSKLETPKQSQVV